MLKKWIVLSVVLLCGTLFAQEQPVSEQPAQEQSALEQPAPSPQVAQEQNTVTSKKVLYERARDVLKESLQNGDKAQAKQALEYLQANVQNGAPLQRFEEYLAYMEMGEFEKGIDMYANERRILLDTLYKPGNNYRIKIEDGLSLYLRRSFDKFTVEKADSLVARVDSSSISNEYKDLYAALIYSEVTIGIHSIQIGGRTHFYNSIDDTTRAENFLVRASRYAEYYPQKVEYMFLKDQTLPYIQHFMKVLRDFRADPLQHKYYTSGFGFSFGKAISGLYGEASDYLTSEVSDMEKLSKNGSFDVYLRIKRIYVGFYDYYGMVNKLDCDEVDEYEDDETISMGLNIGFNVFDSRFLRLEPFVGVGGIYFNSLDDGIDDWESSVTPSATFNLGLNADIRLLTTRPRHLGDLDYALLIHCRYMVQFGSVDYERSTWMAGHDATEFSSKFVTQSFMFGIGLEIW
ncbi:MAG: hypothetical protein MJY99_07435 [Fibrobacter sp.]|nr:hypothetical protein [Fibrobacter sp.]